jgi:hypothetical protein
MVNGKAIRTCPLCPHPQTAKYRGSDYADTLRGQKPAGMLDRCRAAKTCPKIMETFGSAEFWGLRMSPNLIGPGADADIPLPAASGSKGYLSFSNWI